MLLDFRTIFCCHVYPFPAGDFLAHAATQRQKVFLTTKAPDRLAFSFEVRIETSNTSPQATRNLFPSKGLLAERRLVQASCCYNTLRSTLFWSFSMVCVNFRIQMMLTGIRAKPRFFNRENRGFHLDDSIGITNLATR
jgi:hypothetical protein